MTPEEIALQLEALARDVRTLNPPTPPQPKPPAPGETVIRWDGRLSARGVKVADAGSLHNLVEARYLDPTEGGGRTLILVDEIGRAHV